MSAAIIGSESVTAGVVTPYALRSRYIALHPDVYLPRAAVLDAVTRAEAAWLWSRRRGVVAGSSASALHGAKWVDPGSPAELIYDNRHRPPNIRTFADRFADDETTEINRMLVTTPARTALDLACRNPINRAVAAIDALANATELKFADVELLAQRYRGRRGIRRARSVLDLVDAGAESPRETWLRLLLLRAGFPRPRTQIPVYDEFNQLIARLDMGWEDTMIAAEYDGDHHRTDRRQFNRDIARTEALTAMGWILVRITSEDTPAVIIRRVESAFTRRV
jgi:very-short-patch-repair endonuclease